MGWPFKSKKGVKQEQEHDRKKTIEFNESLLELVASTGKDLTALCVLEVIDTETNQKKIFNVLSLKPAIKVFDLPKKAVESVRTHLKEKHEASNKDTAAGGEQASAGPTNLPV